jgi:hypothetical protein
MGVHVIQNLELGRIIKERHHSSPPVAGVSMRALFREQPF